MGSQWHQNMDHCWRFTKTRSRFELHNTSYDKGENDPSTKRRSELHGHHDGDTFAHGVEYWHAFSFNVHPFSDPGGMKDKPGTIMQMHWPSGASPGFAFRVKNGGLRITTRGEGQHNTTRYDGPLSFGTVNDIVYRFVLGTNGALDVWLNGKKILAFRGPVGPDANGSYLCIGPYYASGITCPVVQEYGNIAPFPSRTSLSSRVTSRPAW